MHISLSELESTLVKAVLGVGLPLGLGEEAGRAARALAGQGVDGLAAYAEALDAVDSGRSTGFQVDAGPGGAFVPRDDSLTLSALQAGPSACDLLVAAALNGNDITTPECGINALALAAVDAPLVVLGQALYASAQIEPKILVGWGGPEGLEGLCQGGHLQMSGGGIEDFRTAEPIAVAMVLRDVTGPIPEAASDTLINGLTTDDEIWRRIYAYADRQLVQATESSRLTGAGAGLTDND